MKKIILLIFALLVLLSCKKTQSQVFNESEKKLPAFNSQGELIFEVIREYLGPYPRAIHLMDSLLVLHHERPVEYWISIFNTNGKHKKSLYRKGRGPEEFVGVSSSGFVDGKFWMYDFQNNIIVIIPDLFSNPLSMFKYDVEIPGLVIKLIDESSFVVLGFGTGTRSRFDRYNFKENKVTTGYGDINTLKNFIRITSGEHNYPLMMEKTTFSSFFSVKPDRTKLVAAYYYFDALEIYNATGELKVCLRGPTDKYPKLEVYHEGSGSGKITPRNTKVGYGQVVSTDNYIYALYSGQNIFEHGFSAKNLFVFDWNGNPIKKFKLSHPIETFCVDEKNNIIYSLTSDTGQLVKVNFDLE
ncbi:BF3164 family lipoprotein [Geofilum rubicundum]|uniref:Lipoprotein n=1 Tax=Geofilum rubicundum JCM 15548 TaxID=1236989 RepID=A0A0E9LYJ7_9BACT|nr:BF3164 family lipoprotein [Geofilum rubicundum]GAO30652.1 hypothetical protein JCM15548_12947 [Geofilum rubicundum JCM 15548]